MEGEEVLLLSTFKDKQFLFKVSNQMNFGNIMRNLRNRLDSFNEFDKRTDVTLTYSVGTLENICLDNNDDLQGLFSYYKHFESPLINLKVQVNTEEVDNISLGSHTDNDSESHTSLSLSDDDAISDDMQSDEDNSTYYLEQYCRHEPKVLKTEAWKQSIQSVGQVFYNGSNHFRIELAKFAIVSGFEYEYVKNDTIRVTAECKYKNMGCGWFVHARYNKNRDNFSIRRLCNNHTCNRIYRKIQDYRMCSNIIADEIKDQFNYKAIVSPKDVMKEFCMDYGMDISYMLAWRGVQIAKSKHYGQHTSTYDQLRYLMQSTQMANPNSEIHLEYDGQNSRFQRFFISYYPCILGFNFCRSLLFLDGTFLKSRYKGILLAATAKDANQGLYPLAIAVVDAETKDNWTWFCNSLAKCIRGDRKITFISDRNKGILEAVTQVFPNSPHGFCMLHLRANLKDRLGGTSREVKSRILELLWKAAQTPSKQECVKCISEMLACNEKVQNFLDDAPLQNWTNSYFEGNRYGELYSNAVESFNSWIRNERNLPVKNMIDDIRKKMMTRMAKRRKIASKVTTVICPKFVKWLDNARNKGLTWEIKESNEDVYEVLSNPSVVVNLKERTCSCFMWQIRGFPCSHSIATIISTNRDVMDYVEDYCKATYWLKAHENPIYPTHTLGQPVVSAEDMVIQPPMTKKPPGRPKKNRYESRSEKYSKRRSITCSRCNTKGHHNKNTCTASIED